MAGNRAGAIKAWDKRGRKHSQRGEYVYGAKARARVAARSRGDWTKRNEQIIVGLKTGNPVQVKPNMGGISETYVVKLDNGQKANFKLGIGPENEVRAWDVASLVGMDDLVPPAIFRELDVPGGGRSGRNTFAPGRKEGALVHWQDGEPAFGVQVRGENSFDGDHDLQRAAMFDVVIGNGDRHEGNWVVTDTGGIKLIDHNISFGQYVYSEFLKQAVSRSRTGSGLPSPAEYAKPYIKKKAQIMLALAKSGASNSYIEMVVRRIDIAATSSTWEDLQRRLSDEGFGGG